MTTPTPPQAEWYPPQQPMQQPAPARFTIHYGFALLAFFSLLGTVIPTIFWYTAAANTASDTTMDQHTAASASGFEGALGTGWLLWGGMWTLIWAAFAINHTLKERRK
ncbi:MAG TPA: hypothetical protein VLL82_11055 [Mycobacterium sp.]|nr:hypothetical protein [Mycobacterium sp.]